LASRGDLRLARPQGSVSASASGRVTSSLDPRPRPQPRPRRSRRLSRPQAQIDRAIRDTSSPYSWLAQATKEQDRRPIKLTPVTGNDGSLRASMTSVVLKPLTEARRRQQDTCSANSCASTGHMHFSDGHINMCIATRHFPAGHVAHSYTHIVQLGHLLMSIKGDVQGKKGEEGTNVRAYEYTNARQKDGRGRVGPDPLSLSLSLALSYSPSRSRSRPLATLVTSTTSTLVQDITRLIPLACVPSCTNPSGQGHAATNLLVGPGTPGPKPRQIHLL
jgi:hypothetical protein